MLFTIQLIIILICLFYGARKGGIAPEGSPENLVNHYHIGIPLL